MTPLPHWFLGSMISFLVYVHNTLISAKENGGGGARDKFLLHWFTVSRAAGLNPDQRTSLLARNTRHQHTTVSRRDNEEPALRPLLLVLSDVKFA